MWFFLYSIKINSNPLILKTVFSQGFGVGAASFGEVLLAKKSDYQKAKFVFQRLVKARKVLYH